MVPGPDIIIACPQCGRLARHFTLESGSLDEASLWTDGKFEAPRFPDPPEVVRCSECFTYYWRQDAKIVGASSFGDLPIPEWNAAKTLEEPSEVDYYQAIEQGLGRTKDLVLKLRLLAWWRGNDAMRARAMAELRASGIAARDSAESEEDLGWLTKRERVLRGLAPSGQAAREQWRDNLTALADILDESDDWQRVIKAEAARELADFSQSKQLLATPPSGELRHHARAILDLCDRSATEVWPVRGDEAVTPEEQAEKLRQGEADDAARAAHRARIETEYQAEKKAEEERIGALIQQGKLCPKCKFGYAWDGIECRHCKYHA